MCEKPEAELDIQQYLHAILPLGLAPFDETQARNVALVVLQALDYENVVELFKNDINDERVGKRSLLILETLFLMFENWASVPGKAHDEFLQGTMVSIMEVLIHNPAFWNRLKQSKPL